jgi:hypothetical protein
MSDTDTLNIETVGNQYISLVRRPDGQMDVAIISIGSARNIIGKCIVGKNRRDLISKFFATAEASKK